MRVRVQDEYEDLRRSLACESSLDVVVGALCLHPQLPEATPTDDPYPVNARLEADVLFWLRQLARAKDPTVERDVLIVLTFADKFTDRHSTSKLEETCRALQWAARKAFPAWFPEWAAKRVVLPVAPSPKFRELARAVREQLRLNVAAVVGRTVVPASDNRAVEALRALGEASVFPVFRRDDVLAMFTESDAEERAASLRYCLRIGEGVEVPVSLAGQAATPCVLLTPTVFLGRVLRCFISHRDEDGVPLGARPLLEHAQVAEGIFLRSAIDARVNDEILLGPTARRPSSPRGGGENGDGDEAPHTTAHPLARASVLERAAPSERADLLIRLLAALGFCHQIDRGLPTARVAFPAAMRRVRPEAAAERWLVAVADMCQGPATLRLPWVAVRGVRWRSPANIARVTPAAVVDLLSALDARRSGLDDLGAESALLRTQDGHCCALVYSGSVRGYGPLVLGEASGWCDAYVCARGELPDVAVATALQVVDSVAFVLSRRIRGADLGAEEQQLCTACLSGAQRPVAEAPLSTVIPPGGACPACLRAADQPMVFDASQSWAGSRDHARSGHTERHTL